MTGDEVKKLARLCRLEIPEDKLSNYVRHVEEIISFFNQIEAVDTAGVEPMQSPIESFQVLREDKVEKWTDQNEVVQAAPESVGMLFKVPPVV